jgi:phosphopantetheinyl transferase
MGFAVNGFQVALSVLPGSGKPAWVDQHNEGRRLLARLDGGGRGETGERPGVITDANGRPRFADGHADFSISHSWAMTAVSYLPTDNTAAPSRTGCDIQYVHPARNYDNTARCCFSASERDYIDERGPKEATRRFCRIWTLKEAWIKMNALSIADIRLAPEFHIEDEAGGQGLLVRQSAPRVSVANIASAAALPPAFFLWDISAATGLYVLAAGLTSPLPKRPVLRYL